MSTSFNSLAYDNPAGCFYNKIKSFPNVILNIIKQLDGKDLFSNAISCKLMLWFSVFPLGKCAFPQDESRCWVQILEEDLYPELPWNFQKLKFSEIVPKMPILELDVDPFSPLNTTMHAPTSQFLNVDLPEDSSEAYLQRGLIQKLMRNKYLDSVVSKIKEAEKTNAPSYFMFYHSCSLSAFIFTEFTKSLIEVANTCGQKQVNVDFQKIKQLSWFRFPQFIEDENLKSVSDFKSRFSMEEGLQSSNDHSPKIRNYLMAVVPFPFSSLTDPGECSWTLFEENRSVNPLSCDGYFDLLCDHFELLPNSASREEFLSLFKTLHGQFCLLAHEELKKIHRELSVPNSRQVDPRGVISQILVPHSIADKVLYLSKPYGFIDHSQDNLHFAILMEKIAANPWNYEKAQFRILAHHLSNFNSGIVVNDFGYGNFFNSKESAEFREKIQAFFLNVLVTTASVHRGIQKLANGNVGASDLQQAQPDRSE